MENKDLNDLRKKIIKTGLIGIFIFALSIAGAETSRYISKMPDYSNLNILILVASVIIFFLGFCTLLKFRKMIKIYKTKMKGKIIENEK